MTTVIPEPSRFSGLTSNAQGLAAIQAPASTPHVIGTYQPGSPSHHIHQPNLFRQRRNPVLVHDILWLSVVQLIDIVESAVLVRLTSVRILDTLLAGRRGYKDASHSFESENLPAWCGNVMSVFG